MITSNLLTLKK